MIFRNGLKMLSIILCIGLSGTFAVNPVWADEEEQTVIAWDDGTYEIDHADGFEESDSDETQVDDGTEENVFGTDDRIKVTDTTVFPYRACVYILSTYANGSIYRGSGNLIAPDTVLTAAHNIYSSDRGYATNITVYPAYNNGTAPYGNTLSKRSFVYSGWVSSGDKSSDIGILKLKKPVGQSTGYFGVSASAQIDQKITIAGYPKETSDSADSRSMWKMSGKIEKIDDKFIYYHIDTSHGNSGGGIYNSSNEIVGVHAYGSGLYNYGTRITNEKLSWIKNKKDDLITVFRLYNPNSGEHFYTKTPSEVYNLISSGWSFENVAWYTPSSGSSVYRLYNQNAKVGSHHYTTSVSEKDSLKNSGWRYEGIAWYGI